MSAGAFWFGAYLGIGLILMPIALASAKRRSRVAEILQPGTDPTPFGAGFLIFVALLWPIWLLIKVVKDR